MSNLFLLIGLFLFSACTLVNKEQGNQIAETVSLDQNHNQVEIDTSGKQKDLYGPIANLEEAEVLKLNTDGKNPVIAFELAPALYGSFSYIAFFSALEAKGITPHVINTAGFTSIIACLYAKYKSANRVEWKLFSLINKLKNIAPYSSGWYREIEKFLDTEFKNEKIEQFDIVISISQGKTHSAIDQGNISNVIMQSIKIDNSKSFLMMPHSGHLVEIGKYGLDIVFEINGLPKQLRFKYPNDYLLGIYARLHGHYYSRESTINLDTKVEFIDTIPNLSDLMLKAKSDQQEVILNIEHVIGEWKNKNN